MDGFNYGNDVAERVRALVAESIHQPVSAVPLDARLDATELGIDSLGLIKLTVRLEETFEITMPDLDSPEAAALGSVRDLIALVSHEVSRKLSGGAL